LNNDPRVINDMLKNASLFPEKCQKKLDEDLFQITISRQKYRVNVSEQNCECAEYHDRGTCSHLIYLSHSIGLNLGYYKPIEKFVFLRKRGRPKQAKNALSID
ncbi:unnamed protein product, partial [Brachionus calyciflorus]